MSEAIFVFLKERNSIHSPDVQGHQVLSVGK